MGITFLLLLVDKQKKTNKQKKQTNPNKQKKKARGLFRMCWYQVWSTQQ